MRLAIGSCGGILKCLRCVDWSQHNLPRRRGDRRIREDHHFCLCNLGSQARQESQVAPAQPGGGSSEPLFLCPLKAIRHPVNAFGIIRFRVT